MFEFIVGLFIIYVMIILLPVFLGILAIAGATCVAVFTYLIEKLTNK